MTGNLVGVGTGSVVDAVFGWQTDTLDVVNPTAETVETVVDAASDATECPQIRVLGRRRALKDALADFRVASRAADLVEDGTLALRIDTNLPDGPLLVTGGRVVSLVGLPPQTHGVGSDDAGFVEATSAALTDRWRAAEEYTLRTPGLSRLRETLAASVDPAVERDFAAMLDAGGSLNGDDPLDEVALSLLVAAKHRKLLYDVSKWGEDVGLASKATFSRTKSNLEARGLVDTEKVPIDVGRPRLRLTLTDPDLADAPPTEFVTAARRRLTE